MRIKKLLKNEEGSVLVISLIMLALLSLMGIAATNISTIEIQIAANNRTYMQNFYMAEAAAREAAQKINGLGSLDDYYALGDWAHDKNDVTGYDRKELVSLNKKEEAEEGLDEDDRQRQHELKEALKSWLLDPSHTERANVNKAGESYASFAAMGPYPGGSQGSVKATDPATETYVFIIYGIYNKEDEPNRGQVIVDIGFELTVQQ